MDAAIGKNRRVWLPLAAAALVSVAVAAGVVLDQTRDSPAKSTAGPAPAAVVRQARWRVKTSPAGNLAPLSKASKTAVAAQAPALEGLVKEVFGALFLEPDKAPGVVRANFTTMAAQSFLARRIGVSADATFVKTLRRRGHIAVQADGARRAAAEITVVARVKSATRRFDVIASSRLYLTKKNGDWKVIAFDVDQRPWHNEKPARKRDRSKSKGAAS